MGVFDFISEGMKGADNIAERAAINAAFFGMAPDWLVTDIQNTMRSIGIPLPSAISPSGMSQLGATTLVLGGILAAVIAIIMRLAYGLFQKYMLFAISLAIIVTGIALYETDKKTPLRTLLRWVETASYFVLMGVITWIVIWLIGIKQIYFFEKGPKLNRNSGGPSFPMVAFGIAVFLVLFTAIIFLVEEFVPSFK